MLSLDERKKQAKLEKINILCNSNDKILVNAGCGTGKTTILIKSALLHMNKNMAIITFTNAAAEELKKRLGTFDCFVGTIHKFAYEQIKLMEEKYNFSCSLLSKSQIEKIIKKIFIKNDMSLYYLQSCLEFILNRREYLNTKGNVPIFFELVHQEYQSYKTRINLYDITDTPEYLLQKMSEYNDYLDLEGLFVDEAQDLSPEQVDLILQINSKYKFVIGDPRQSIYQFRGADPNAFTRFLEKGFIEYKLTYNYRSYQEILNLANSGLFAMRGSGGTMTYDLKQFMKFKPQILCRANREVEKIKRYYPNVTTVHKSKGLEYDYVILIDFETNGDPEEEAIKYVAITRAKNGIVITGLKSLLSVL